MPTPTAASPKNTARTNPVRKRTAKNPRREPGRWVREAKGIVALALAGFDVVALAAYDVSVHPLEQSSPVGPVGGWLGAASFWAVGYAGYLLPLLLALYGVSAFVRPRIATGWPAVAGLGLLVVSVTGILARTPETLSPYRIHKGGVIGRGVSEALRLSVGTVGTWINLAALIPVGVLFVTRISYGVLSRALRARVRRLRLLAKPKSSASGEPLVGVPAGVWLEPQREPAPPPLVVKEPAKPKPGLVEQGLAWQETFAF